MLLGAFALAVCASLASCQASGSESKARRVPDTASYDPYTTCREIRQGLECELAFDD